MPEDRKLKLVLKDHDCSRIGEITPYESFDAVSRVNDVGEATLVASYCGIERSDAVLDALDTPDVILEAYIMPPGHETFLDTPAWSGFLRDRRVTQEGPTRKVTAVFKDYNHLLQRRVVKPPPGASHDEGYGCTPDVMRDLVRRHCAELADAERQFPGLSVEPNECEEGGGLYGADASLLVLGNNHLEWVRCNALYSWNGHLYAGLEPQESSGTYGQIWRSADGDGWELVYDGAPSLTYGDDVTAIHSFCEFDGKLFAGGSTDYLDDGDAVVLMSTDGQAWGVVEIFTGHTAVWALEEFDGELYAGTKGGAAETVVWGTTDGDGLVWGGAMDGSGQSNVYALYTWGDHLYCGLADTSATFGLGDRCSVANYTARIRRSDDGATWNTVYTKSRCFGILCFLGGSDGNLYAGTGTSRFDWYDPALGPKCPEHRVDQWARVLRSPDGAAWNLTGPEDADEEHPRTGIVDASASGVTCLLEVTVDDGTVRLVACVGGVPEGTGTLWASADWGGEWYQAFVPYIGYRYSLAIASHGGSEYAAFGSVERDNWGPFPWIDFQPDHGDVWRVVIPADDIPESGTVARWVVLLDKLRELAEQSGVHDFGVVGLDGTGLYCDPWQSFQFQVRNPQWGTDNRWDGTSGVTFSLPADNMAAPEYAEVRGARPTYLYLLGAAAAEQRTVLEFPNTGAMDDSPWNRVEAASDAQGVDSPQAMLSLGWSELWLQGPQRTFDFQAMETDTLHWRGGGDDADEGWGLGDIVTATFTGATANCKIMEVALFAHEGDPVYVVRPTFEALEVEVAGAVEQYMLLGAGFVAAGGGIFRSTPDVAWFQQATVAGTRAVRSLLRTQMGLVLAGTDWNAEVWRSEDEGLSWAKVQEIDATANSGVMRMIQVSETGTLLLGTGRAAEVWRSTDGGHVWTLAQDLSGGTAYVYGLVEAANGDLLAGGFNTNVAVDARVYRSQNDGVTWTQTAILSGTNANYIYDMVVAENGYVVVGTQGGFANPGEFWLSQDNGATFSFVQDVISPTGVFCFCLLDDGVLLAGTYDVWGAQVEIWRSADNGQSWAKISEVNAGLDLCYVLTQDHEGAVIGGFQRNGGAVDGELWRSIDGGYSWVQQFVTTGFIAPESLLRVGEMNE